VQISTRQRGAPLDLIVSEAMILANSSWGGWLGELGVPGLYRSQASLAPGIKVRMGTRALPHAGLGVKSYAWSTSPLRRYTDLVNQWQIIAAARHGKTAALAAPFKPKDADLFSILSGFDAAYAAYNAHQGGMERFWTLKHLQQQGIAELDATLIKDVQRRPGARRHAAAGVPGHRHARLDARCARARQARRDRRDRARRARHRHRAPRCRAGRSRRARGERRGRGRSGRADRHRCRPRRQRSRAGERARMNLRDLSSLQIALGLSVAAHALLLGLRFADPETFNRVFTETPLEVILVNAKTNERPDKARAIAQTSLAGGGDLERGRATSPLPPSTFTAVGDSMEDAQRQVEAMQAQQMLLLAQIKQQLAAMPMPDPRNQGSPSENAAREEKRRQLIKMLAEIERRVNEENARPKKRYLSPATREATYAVYVDALRRRIEQRGTENFPELAGKKLYGELTMMVTVNFDGSILGTEIVEGSGNQSLDRRAQAIVRSIGNFGKFTDAMRRQTDQIVLPSRFKFTRDETLETQVSSSSRQ
jgi:protein TonB